MGTFADEYVRIRPDLTGFAQEVKTKAEMGAGDTGKSVGKKVGVGVLAGLGTAFAAGKIVDFFKDAFAEAQEAAKVTALTNAALKSTGGVANVTAKDITGLADSMSNLTGVDDETIQSAENVLLTFTRVRNEAGKGNDVFNQATVAAENLSAALGTDLQAASILVGKALNDPIGGLTALKKAGIQFTDAQKDQIKTMVQAGDTMGAQKMILAELTTEFGGAAAAAATPADKATVAWKNFEEDVGTRLLPMLNSILTFGLANQKWLVPLAASIAELAVGIGVAAAASKTWSAAQTVLGIGLEGNVGKIKKTTAAIAGFLIVAQAVGRSIQTDMNPQIDELSAEMVHYAATGELGAEATRLFGNNLAGFLAAATSSEAALSRLGDVTGNAAANLIGMNGPIDDSKEAVAALDTALAQLTTSGHADQAAAAFKQIWATAQAAGVPLDALQRAFPQYVAAAAAAAKGTDKVGASMQKATDAGKDFLDMWNELTRAMVSEDHAALEADKAIAGLGDTFKGTAHSIDVNTMAGLTNRVALEDAASAAQAATAAYLDNGGTAAGAAAKMAAYEAAAVKSTGATGKAKDAVKALADQLFQLPVAKTITVTANVNVNGAAALNRVIKEMALHGIGQAHGGIVDFYAQGGLEDHVAQIVSAGTVRVWAEPETGGEAYIPLGAGKRSRSTAVLSDVAKRFGYGLFPIGGPGGSLVGAAGPVPAAGSLAPRPRSPLSIQNYYAAPAHSEYRLAQELDWLARGGG